jgi:hypothetical protein
MNEFRNSYLRQQRRLDDDDAHGEEELEDGHELDDDDGHELDDEDGHDGDELDGHEEDELLQLSGQHLELLEFTITIAAITRPRMTKRSTKEIPDDQFMLACLNLLK